MSFINTIFNAVFDAFFSIIGFLGGIPAMWIFSILIGVGFLFIFKWTSDQKAIKRVKDRISAGFLAIRLFKDDFSQVWKANGSVFTNAFRYMGQALRPMLIMIVPVLFILPQVNHWYGYEPLKPDLDERVLSGLLSSNGMALDAPIIGDTSTTVTAKLDDSVNMEEATFELIAAEGVNVVAGPVAVTDLKEVSWRVQAVEEGEHDLMVSVSQKVGKKPNLKTVEHEVHHTLYVGEAEKFRKISPVTTRDFVSAYLYPANQPIAGDNPVKEVVVQYPEAEFNLLGWETHWIIAFFIISLVFGFALKGVFGVEI